MSTVDNLMELADEYQWNYTGSSEGNSVEKELVAHDKLRTALEAALRAEYERGRGERDAELERLRAELSTFSAATASVQSDQRAAIDQARELLRIVTAERDAMRSKIADDSFAMTFQTIGQYRTALLRHK